MSAVKPTGVVDKAVDQIRQRIMRGVYVPGQRLAEPDLIRELDVSRTALREAFRRLEAENLLETALYRGVAVRRYTRQDLVELFDVRFELEGMAARLAAEACKLDTNRKRVEAITEDLQTALDDDDAATAYAQANNEFHDLVLELAGNRVLADFLRQLQPPTLRLIYSRLVSSKGRAGSMAEHREIIDALLATDSVLAEQRMQAHIRLSQEKIFALGDEYFS